MVFNFNTTTTCLFESISSSSPPPPAYLERQRQRVQPDQASAPPPAGGDPAKAGSREAKARQPRVSSDEAADDRVVEGGRKRLPAEVDRLDAVPSGHT